MQTEILGNCIENAASLVSLILVELREKLGTNMSVSSYHGETQYVVHLCCTLAVVYQVCTTTDNKKLT